MSASSATHGAEDSSFYLERIAVGQQCRIVAVNKSAAPVTVAVRVGGASKAEKAGGGQGLTQVVPPGGEKEVTSVFARVDPCRVEISHSETIGDAFATPEANYPYRLPFAKGTRMRVTQAPGVPGGTHRDALTRYAVDFGVPVGTQVLAARAGTVIEARDGFDRGGIGPAFAEKVNFVSILHDDGTFAQYAHLAPGGVWVRPGERVETGQALGLSGKSGYASGPHLHVDLRRALVKADGSVAQESIPFSFYRRSGEKITFRWRSTLTAD